MSASRTPAPANFDRVARLYRWAEYLLMGSALERCRETFLRSLLTAKRALVLGDGDGRFLSVLLQANKQLQAVAIDASRSMLALLTTRCASPRVRTLQHSLSYLPWTELPQPDLVVSHFVLDCLSQAQVDSLVQQVADHVAPGTLWIISDFAIPQTRPWNWIGSLYIRVLYAAFRVLTGLRVQALPAITAPMQRAGFERLERLETLRGLLFSELWERNTTNRSGLPDPPSATLRSSGT